VLLEQELVVPAVFRREGIDQFRGAEDDTINVTVEGVVPFRTYGWRNDRSTELQFDTYKERKVAVTFGGDLYSALKLTDEQAEMDLDGWGKLVQKQTRAIGRGLEFHATQHLLDAPYAVTLGVPSTALRKGLIRSRATLRALHAPAGVQTILCGVNWESALLSDESLNLASAVGESEAVSALREATLGRRYGFNFVVAEELPANDAIALTDSAFVFATGAPSVPQSVPFGASASHEGVALRWIRDYDSTRTQDRSIVNTYYGYRSVTDVLVGRDETTGQAFVGEHEHMVRAIRLRLDGTDSLPDGTLGRPAEGFTPAEDQELALITGIGTPA
jgi:hypothetical protein